MDELSLELIPEAERWWEHMSFEELVHTLDGDIQERYSIAVHELGRRGINGDVRVIPHLIRVLDRDYHSVAESAVDDLAQIGATAVPLLIGALIDRSLPALRRGRVARALGSGGDPRALRPMLTILQDRSNDLDVRRMLAFYLARPGDRSVVEPLLVVAASSEEDVTVRKNTLLALGELRDPRSFDVLLSLLSDEQFGNAAGSALEALEDSRAIDQLLPTFATDDEGWRTQTSAIVGKAGESAVQPLLALLASDDWRVRSASARALGFAEDARAIEPLIHLLQNDSVSEVRSHAADSLGFLDPVQVVSPLVQALSDEDVHVRLAAMHGLYRLTLHGQAPTSILPTIQRAVENDTGTIQGQEVITYVGERVVRQLRWNMEEEERHRHLE